MRQLAKIAEPGGIRRAAPRVHSPDQPSAWRSWRLGGSPLLLCIAIALSAAACAQHDAGSTAEPEVITPAKDAITKTTESGPVKATVRVWPAKPTLGDSIYVRLEIEAAAGVSIDAPFQEAGDQRLGRFRVVGFTRETEHKPGGGQVEQQTYTLEAPASGRQRIPPLRLEMVDGRTRAPAAGSAGGSATASAADTKKPQELLTDEVPLEIAPVPAEAANKPLAAAAGTLDPDVDRTSWLVILGIGGGVVALGVGSAFAIRSLRARRRVQAQRSAYDEAVAQLAALEVRGAPDADAADAWFVQLSAIVRRYVEHRYDIRAPELTTEEFLVVATARPELASKHRGLLSQFLERCDRVKFAGYRPEAAESIATLAAARGFIEDTRLREAVAA